MEKSYPRRVEKDQETGNNSGYFASRGKRHQLREFEAILSGKLIPGEIYLENMAEPTYNKGVKVEDGEE